LYDIEGTVHVRLRDYGRAIESYRKALDINPEYAEVYNNLSAAQQASGDLEGAIASCGKALEIRPDYGQAAANILSLSIQMDRPLGQFAEQTQNLARTDLYLATCMAIRSFINGALDDVRTQLASLESVMTEAALAALSPVNRVFVSAYHRFLSELCAGDAAQEMPTDGPGPTLREVFHIGESHCLSFGHQTLLTEDASYVVRPRIIFGAKAWHFASSAASGYKSVLKDHIRRIPDGSVVFLSFGEIDCRPDEGIIQYHSKHGGDLDSVTKKAALGYVRYVESCFHGTKTQRFYFEVPAPVRDEAGIGSDPATHEMRVGVIRMFNEALKTEVTASRAKFVEIHELTADDQGSSNLLYICDPRHLGTNAWPKIADMIRSQL
jgi:hypothetical protein